MAAGFIAFPLIDVISQGQLSDGLLDLWRVEGNRTALGEAEQLGQPMPQRFGGVGQVGHQQLQAVGSLGLAGQQQRLLRKTLEQRFGPPALGESPGAGGK